MGDQRFVKTGTPALPTEMLHADIKGRRIRNAETVDGNDKNPHQIIVEMTLSAETRGFARIQPGSHISAWPMTAHATAISVIARNVRDTSNAFRPDRNLAGARTTEAHSRRSAVLRFITASQARNSGASQQALPACPGTTIIFMDQIPDTANERGH